MIWSIYPTDDSFDRVACQAAEHGGVVFTSLHLPEVEDVESFLGILADLHDRFALTFWADVSPVAIDLLRPELRDVGIVGLRYDFGFGTYDIHKLAERTGLGTAINASTIDATTLDSLIDLRPVGWHNYYPRPSTGITTSWCLKQSRLFIDRGLPVTAFIPGERGLRGPLHRGLPTLEHHRYRNAWANVIELRQMGVTVAVAEGTLTQRTLTWIERFDTDGVITLPLCDLACAELLGEHTLRREETGISWRIDGTRGMDVPDAPNAGLRPAGSLQMDTLDRYCGEVHLMVRDEPLDGNWVRVGEVAGPYAEMVAYLSGGMKVDFTMWG
ncbi:DUF871 domain-containing protein [Cutibacterium sp. WCA-380-WT-3A]|uniref:DUF871 domain-containing protein n=1 Tax=Cutibacterium porci TaxID=2605781 RepID=A0A7K0J6F9_9ACTN|nr:MupG family TIM beta-alpha barrel fold protein [Cutibacterium porci]MSS45512.1 DUF871 domain-containing protein [Cutibacterium porci]